MSDNMIARKSTLILTSSFMVGLLNYISLFIIARYYDFPKFALGLLNFSTGFVALFGILANLGFPTTHVKRVSEGKDISKCNATFFVIRLFLTALMVIAIVSSIMVWKYGMHRGFESYAQEKAVYVMLCYYILLLLAQNFTYTYRAKREIAITQTPYIIEALVRTIAIAYFVFAGFEATWIVYAYVIGGIALFSSAFSFFREPISVPTKEYFSSYLKFAIPISISSISFIIMTNLDKVLIQLFWGYDEGADYFSIVRLSRFINNISLALGTLLLPTLSTLYAKNKIEEMKGTVIDAERYISMVLMPIVLIMIFLAKPIIHVLLSDQFYTAVPILQVLPLFVLLDALNRPYGAKLAGMNLPNFVRNRAIIMLSINVVLNLILIPKDIKSMGIKLFGLAGTGAAIATVIAYFVGLIYTRIISYKISKIGMNFCVAKHFIAALLSGFLLSYLNRFYTIERWFDLIIFAVLGIFIYISILFIMREFRKEDFNFFMDTLNPKKMFIYIADEIKEKVRK